MASFFFNDTATTEIYTLSLHDALPISRQRDLGRLLSSRDHGDVHAARALRRRACRHAARPARQRRRGGGRRRPAVLWRPTEPAARHRPGERRPRPGGAPRLVGRAPPPPPRAHRPPRRAGAPPPLPRRAAGHAAGPARPRRRGGGRRRPAVLGRPPDPAARHRPGERRLGPGGARSLVGRAARPPPRADGPLRRAGPMPLPATIFRE